MKYNLYFYDGSKNAVVIDDLLDEKMQKRLWKEGSFE